MVRDILVLGLGESAVAVARHALAKGDRVTVYAGEGGPGSEERAAALSEAGAEVMVGTEEVEGRYDLCVPSPGIPATSGFYASGRAASAEVVSEPEYAWRESPDDWVAVTGTNGKTTTTALVAHLIREGAGRAELCGNTQATTTTAAIEERPGHDFIVAEVSSYQLASTVQFSPRVAVLLNITPDHLSWHGSPEAYADAKLKIFRNLETGQTAVVTEDVPDVDKIARVLRRSGVRTVRVGRDFGNDCAWTERGMLLVRDSNGKTTRLVNADELKIRGRHNVTNALCAAAVALDLKIDPEAVRAGLRSFEPLPHRIEKVGEVGGVAFYDDSKATNVDATVKALGAFPRQKVVLLLGGRDKGTDLSGLVEAAGTACSAIVAYGEGAERLYGAFEASPVRRERADGMAAAFDAACELARPGEAVLLSPACASFDEFSGFAERGDAFKELVRKREGISD